MTDQVHSLTVVLDKDVRIDDAEPLMEAIKQMRGVIEVRPMVSDCSSFMAEERAKRELRQKLWDTFWGENR